MQVINVSQQVARFQISTTVGVPPTQHSLKPGESVEIKDAYCVRMRTGEQSEPQPSVIEKLTNAMVLPVNDKRARQIVAQRASEQRKATAKES